jgi:ketosteroid isomerase-like protein
MPGEVFAPEGLAEALRVLQNRAKMNRDELASAVGVSSNSMSNYLNGGSAPSVSVLRKLNNLLAERLGLDPVHLWIELGMLVDVPSAHAVGRREKKRSEEIHRAIEAALSTGDVEEVLRFCHEDIVVHVPGRNPMSGEYRGKKQVAALAGVVMQLKDQGVWFKAETVAVSDQRTVHVHALHLNEGEGEVRSLVVCHIQEGKITEVWVYPEDQHQADDVWTSVGLGIQPKQT